MPGITHKDMKIKSDTYITEKQQAFIRFFLSVEDRKAIALKAEKSLSLTNNLIDRRTPVTDNNLGLVAMLLSEAKKQKRKIAREYADFS